MCGCLSCASLLGIWSATQACALTGNQTGDSLVHSPALNSLSYTSQAKIIIHLDVAFFCKMDDLLKIFLNSGNTIQHEIQIISV